VEGDWETRHAFFARNAEVREEVHALEDRVRRRDILVDDETIFDFYDARIPASVVSAAHFDRCTSRRSASSPELLTLTRERLMRSDAAAALADAQSWPTVWKQGDHLLPLSYKFEPGAPDDGVTVHVPLASLGRVRADRFEWLVPGLRAELVTALIRGLPKELRRPLVPVPDVVQAVLERLKPRRKPLLDALSAELEALRGVRVPGDAWGLEALPPHLRMTFSVEDEKGKVLARGQDLDRLREQVRPLLQARLAASAPDLVRHGLRGWTIGTLPRTVPLPGGGGDLLAYPALVDEGEAVGVRVFDTPEAQKASMQAGTRRLLALTIPSPNRRVRDTLDIAAQYALESARHGGLNAVLEDAAAAAIEHLMNQAGGPAWDEEGFARLRGHVAGHLYEETLAVAGRAVRILEAERAVRERLARLNAPALEPGALGRRGAAPPSGRPQLRQRRRRRAPRRPRALPPSRRAAPRAPSSRSCRRPGAHGGGPRTRSRLSRPRRGARTATPDHATAAGRHVDARRAPRLLLRAGARHPRVGVGEADPARARRGRLDRRADQARRSRSCPRAGVRDDGDPHSRAGLWPVARAVSHEDAREGQPVRRADCEEEEEQGDSL
jgi:ATP-dependent helicase HrpA